jgi:hypothetical protein
VRAATAIGDEALRRTYGGPRPVDATPDRPDPASLPADLGPKIKAAIDSSGDLATWTLREPEPPIDLSPMVDRILRWRESNRRELIDRMQALDPTPIADLWRRVARLPSAVRDALYEQIASRAPSGELPPLAVLDALLSAAERGDAWPASDAPAAEDSP